MHKVKLTEMERLFLLVLLDKATEALMGMVEDDPSKAGAASEDLDMIEAIFGKLKK